MSNYSKARRPPDTILLFSQDSFPTVSRQPELSKTNAHTIEEQAFFISTGIISSTHESIRKIKKKMASPRGFEPLLPG